MSFVAGVLIGIVPILIAWLAKTVFFRRQLYLVQPKLFDYSGLGGNESSKTVEVTVINSGRRSEEDIRVQFAPSFSYVIVASNSAGHSIDQDGVLKIDRLAPKQELTLVLVAEGGEFRKEHILGLSSSTVVGKVKSSLQEAQATPEQTVFALLVLFLIVFPLGYALGKIVEVEVWPRLVSEVAPVDEGDGATKFDVKEIDKSGSYGVEKAAIRSRSETVKVVGIKRKGDEVFVAIALENKSSERLSYTLSLSTPVSEKRGQLKGAPNYIKTGVVLFPNSTKEIQLSDYLPSKGVPQLILLEVRIDKKPAEMVWIDYEINILER